MSRALEKHVLESLSKGNPQHAYDEIGSIFNGVGIDDELLEIEFLGQSHPLGPDEFFLRDGNAVAIPKLRLIQAFTVAHQHLKTVSQPQEGGNSAHSRPLDEMDIRRATSVLLLTDPEHLTAANSRKRIIAQAIADGCEVGPLLRKEKHFVDSLLTSPLHRHSKSPTLWSHRRWLLEQHRKFDVNVDIAGDIRLIILKSGERHPRNYYAWSHARWLLAAFRSLDDEQGSTTILSHVKNWCLRNHNDISGWSFLFFLLRRTNAPQADGCSSVFGEVIRLAESLQWRNDSVWWFIHAMISGGLVPSGETPLFEEIGGKLFGSQRPRHHDVELASKWYHEYQEKKRDGPS